MKIKALIDIRKDARHPLVIAIAEDGFDTSPHQKLEKKTELASEVCDGEAFVALHESLNEY